MPSAGNGGGVHGAAGSLNFVDENFPNGSSATAPDGGGGGWWCGGSRLPLVERGVALAETAAISAAAGVPGEVT